MSNNLKDIYLKAIDLISLQWNLQNLDLFNSQFVFWKPGRENGINKFSSNVFQKISLLQFQTNLALLCESRKAITFLVYVWNWSFKSSDFHCSRKSDFLVEISYSVSSRSRKWKWKWKKTRKKFRFFFNSVYFFFFEVDFGNFLNLIASTLKNDFW